MKKKIAAILFAAVLPGTFAALAVPAPAGICVWSCQMNLSGSWAYWFARNLSNCAAPDCLPRGGTSPSGTACTSGDPDIPGDCRATPVTTENQPVFSLEPPAALVCSGR
ncbi:MAG TPA: hypothetical protein VGG20_23085 [Thermoanaerobaculia bacterium]|jgi:hypothetical protein